MNININNSKYIQYSSTIQTFNQPWYIFQQNKITFISNLFQNASAVQWVRGGTVDK